MKRSHLAHWISDPSVRFYLPGFRQRSQEKRIEIWRSDRFRKTSMEVIGPTAIIRLEILARSSPRHRREVAKSFFRQIKPWLRYFSQAHIHHWDSAMNNFHRDEERGVRTFVAQGLDQPDGEVGYRIRMQRLNLGWSQEALARRARVNRSHLSEIERGLNTLQDATRLRLEALLGISLLPSSKRAEAQPTLMLLGPGHPKDEGRTAASLAKGKPNIVLRTRHWPMGEGGEEDSSD